MFVTLHERMITVIGFVTIPMSLDDALGALSVPSSFVSDGLEMLPIPRIYVDISALILSFWWALVEQDMTFRAGTLYYEYVGVTN